MSPAIIGGAASLMAKAGTPDAYPSFGMTMRFKVVVPALGKDLGRWSSCKGLKVTFNTTAVKEGGDYTASTFLPERVEYGRVTLERAMTKGDSANVVDWLRNVQSKWLTPTPTPLELGHVSVILFDATGEAERKELARHGVRAEVAGILLDAHGDTVPSGLTDRMIGITAEQMRAIPEVIGIVYGLAKVHAVLASVRGGLVNSLVTHSTLATALIRAAG